MSDTQQDESTNDEQQVEEQAQEAPETERPDETPEEQAKESQDDADADEADDGDHEELPEWAKKQLKRARTEAANYRRQVRDAEERLSSATSPEEFQAVKDELAQARLELETERIASRHHLPDELRQVLKGSTPDEIEAHAEILAKYVGSGHSGIDPDDVSGGLNPSNEDDGITDPRALAAKHRRS